MNRLIIFLSTILCCFQLFSQSVVEQAEEWREVLLERMDKENDQQNINNVIERLSEVINNPILINICTKEELEQIPFLSDTQIENLLYYLYVYGEMKSIHELRFVEDFDLETIQLVTPFFRVEPRQKIVRKGVDNLLKQLRHQVLFRFDTGLDKKYGYVDKSDSVLAENPNKQYLGSSAYYSLRYRLEQSDRMRAGFVLEKDAGERGVDYWSGFIQWKNRGIVKNLVAGNYKLRIATGLVMNNSFSLGKNAMGADYLSRGAGITPHASVDEYNYLQGIAAELGAGRWSILPFWSYRRLDARVERDTILSVKKDGLHHLVREKDKKHQADLISSGIHIGWRGSFYKVGISGCYHVFNKVYYPDRTFYNLNYFRGKRSGNLSVNYQLRRYGLLFAGETACSENGRWATLQMLTFSPASELTFSLLQRYYDAGYHSWFGKSYSEGSELNNESGVSLYFGYKPIAYLEMRGGVDFFRFPNAKFGINAPSSGYEVTFQTSYQQQERLCVQLRYKLKQKDKNRSGLPDSLPSVQSYQRHQLGGRIRCVVSDFFFLNTGLEATFYRFEGEKPSDGFLISQSAGYKSAAFPLQVDLAVALFDTEDTRTKVYLSEKNVLYGFGIPSFYGNGMRFSCHLRYELRRWLTCWVKVANTHYFDREEIGSGLEMIRGRNKTDLWAQLQVRF